MPEPIDDGTLEQLNAFLDGELSAGARAEFEQRLAREPDLRAFLARLQSVDRDLKSSHGEPPHSPPAETLMAAVRSFAAAQTAETGTAASNVVDLMSHKRPSLAQSGGWRAPIAASIALCVGAGGMWLALQQISEQPQSAAVSLTDGVVTERTPLFAALEQTPSGDVLADATNKIRPILTFASKDGRFCREFEAFGGKATVVGVACKDERGWKMEVLLSAAPHAPGDTQYAPASGFNAKALDDVVTQLMDGQSLSKDAEKTVRDQGWRKRN
jgi:negative regulator of sigma E activity